MASRCLHIQCEKFLLFSQSNTSSQQFLPAKIFLLITISESWTHCSWAAAPVTQQKIDPFCCTNRHQAKFRNFESLPSINSAVDTATANTYILGVSLLLLVSDQHALISMAASYYYFDVETHTEFHGRVAIFMRELVGGVVRWPCCKIKMLKFYPGVFVGDLWKFMLSSAIWY